MELSSIETTELDSVHNFKWVVTLHSGQQREKRSENDLCAYLPLIQKSTAKYDPIKSTISLSYFYYSNFEFLFTDYCLKILSLMGGLFPTLFKANGQELLICSFCRAHIANWVFFFLEYIEKIVEVFIRSPTAYMSGNVGEKTDYLDVSLEQIFIVRILTHSALQNRS